MSKAIGCECALCGERLTAPMFFGGKPYGSACYKKISGGIAGKRNGKARYATVTVLSFVKDGNSCVGKVTLSDENGKEYVVCQVIKDMDGKLHHGKIVFESDVVAYLQTHNSKGIYNFKF